jgi:glycosyltransferase involved in cell wall biosynthesis
MRICLVSLSSLPYHVSDVPGAYGGAEAQVALLAETLISRGHTVSIVVTNYVPAEHDSRRRTSLPLINAYALGAGVPGLRFLTPRWTGFHRALAKADADVYFQMCAAAATGQVAWFCRRRKRVFVFATASDSDVDSSAVRLGARDRRIYAYGLARADAVVTQHERQAATLQRSYGVSSTPIAMGVRLPEASPEPVFPPYVLWLGTLRGVKRPELWLEMARRFPDTRFVMVGGRARTEPEVYDRSAATAGELPNVEFHGAVPAVEPFLDGASVLLNTSEVEGFPTTFLEAWARGVPTVSFFDPDGLCVKHGMGWVAATPEVLEVDLRAALDSPEVRRTRGLRGRAYVEREHAPSVVAERMEAVMKRALGQPG